MPATKSGIYHNLRESKYTISNTEVVFFFSSEVYLRKFLDRYVENRTKYKKKMGTELNFDTLADIELYNQIETRGFFVRLKRAMITKDDLYKYAVRRMSDKESLEWERN